MKLKIWKSHFLYFYFLDLDHFHNLTDTYTTWMKGNILCSCLRNLELAFIYNITEINGNFSKITVYTCTTSTNFGDLASANGIKNKN